jgi:hypothetical protein
MNLRKWFPIGMVPLVNEDRTPTTPWQQFFAQMIAQPGPIATVAVGASPFAYKASQSGHLLIVGGTVSDVSMLRGRVTISTGQIAGFFPMSLGDTITITYAVIPTAVYFVPD